MRMRLLAVATVLASAGLVSAAELPSRSVATKQSGAKLRKCEIGGEPGVELAGGTCVRVSGYVSAGVAAGTIKH